jgi:hypothetical protein
VREPKFVIGDMVEDTMLGSVWRVVGVLPTKYDHPWYDLVPAFEKQISRPSRVREDRLELYKGTAA